MTDAERDELIENSLLKTLDAADETRVQQLLREDESFRQEYEFQKKLIQQVRLKNKQEFKSMFAQFEADYQASKPADEDEDDSARIIPIEPVRNHPSDDEATDEDDDQTPIIPINRDQDADEIPLWRQGWFRVAATVLVVAVGSAILWKTIKPGNEIADNPDTTRVKPPDTARIAPTPFKAPKLQDQMAQQPKKPIQPAQLQGPVRLPYFESDNVRFGFGDGKQPDEYRTVILLADPEAQYEFQDTLKVYLPQLPAAKTKLSLVYDRTDDIYYLTAGKIRYEIIKGLQGKQPLKESRQK